MKYKGEETIKEITKFIHEMLILGLSDAEFWKYCSIHHIATRLDVHRDTIYDWMKKYPEVSDAIKRWEELRNSKFLELRKKDGAWIFLAKNWLGMRDQQGMEHTGSVDIKYISHIPKSEKKE